MNDRVVKNPNFKNNGELHASLRARGTGTKDYPNSHTEVEHLGGGKFAASIGIGHRVFFDKADGDKPKKHKLTDERSTKDYVLIQGVKCCVEVYPYYAKYFDVQHEEVRLYEERWAVQRLFNEPDDWRDVDAYNPQIAVEEYPEPAGDVVKVTVAYDTDYGVLTVEYFQRDCNALKHNVTFINTSGTTETFRVLQRWAGIVGEKCNGEDYPLVTDEPRLAFRKADGKLALAENLRSMMFNEDGSEKTDQCLQRPISIEAHAQGMKADFVYGNWVLAQDESLEIDPDTATLDDPTEDGYIQYHEMGMYSRYDTDAEIFFGVAEAGGFSKWNRGYVEWSIDAIPDAATITKTEFRYHGSVHHTSATNTDIRAMASQPSVEGDDEVIYDDVADGTAYLSNNAVFPVVFPTKDVGGATGPAWDTDPSSDVQAALASDWFAIGMKTQESETPNLSDWSHKIYSEDKTDAADPKPTLYVEYTPPAVGLENKSANMGSKMVAAGLI